MDEQKKTEEASKLSIGEKVDTKETAEKKDFFQLKDEKKPEVEQSSAPGTEKAASEPVKLKIKPSQDFFAAVDEKEKSRPKSGQMEKLEKTLEGSKKDKAGGNFALLVALLTLAGLATLVFFLAKMAGVEIPF